MQELFNLDGEVAAATNGKWITVGQAKVFYWYCESKKHMHVDPQLALSCCSSDYEYRDVEKSIDPEQKETRILDQNWIEVALFSNGQID